MDLAAADEALLRVVEQTRAAASDRGSGTQRHDTELWLEVRVNDSAMARPAHLIRQDDGQLLADGDDLLRWHIRLPDREPFPLRGKAYYSLDSIQGLSYRIDERRQLLMIRAQPRVFEPVRLTAHSSTYAPADPPASGAFLNYNLQYQRLEGEERLDGLYEVGVFNTIGFGTTSFLDHRLQDEQETVRLESAWTYDQPLSFRSLRLGDTIGRGGAWGRPVRFGGIQWGTDFTTRPDFVSFPMPALAGEAALPSTLDLYVDNALRLSSDVSPGPFTIDDVPVVSGEGQISVVVRDLLGREQVITQPYYASTELLRPRLHDYTYEAGFLRQDYAVESNDYGSFFATGTHRYGFSDRLTGEFRLEWMREQQTAGASVNYYWPAVGIIDLTGALSHAPEGDGGLASFGVERQGRNFSYSLRSQISSERFTQLGVTDLFRPPRHQTLVRANLATGGGGAVFASYVHQSGTGQSDIDLISTGYNLSVFGDYFLSLYAVHSLNGDPIDTYGLNITHAFGPRTSASVSWTRQDDVSTPAIQLQRSLPQGSGYGYRLSATDGAYERQDAMLSMQNDIGTYSIEASRVEGKTGQRFNAGGGVALLGGGLHLARRLDQSFAVVKVGDYADIPVYADNHEVAMTDASGSALVPSLRAYEKNRISIRQDALPLDARVDALKVAVTPRRRSGSLVEFPVHRERGALIRIVLEDGTPMPAGAVVRLEGGEKRFPVARRGEAYVTGLETENRLLASWKGRECELRFTLPPDAGPLPVVGPLVCRGVSP